MHACLPPEQQRCAMVREECVHTRDTGCPLIALLREGSCSSVHEAIPRPRSLLSPLLSVFRSLSLSLFLPPLASSLRSSRTSFPPFPVRDHSARPSHFFPPSPPPPRHPPEVVAGPLLSSLFLPLSLGFVRIFSSLLPSRFTSFSAVYVPFS